MKELLFKVTAADCRWDYYVGTGNGGQNKQKTASACRCTHVASGAVGKAEDHRSQHQNKRLAFERMARTEAFQKWAKVEAMRRSGELALVQERVDRQLRLETTVEVQDEKGAWRPAPAELQVSDWDIQNSRG